MAERSKQLITLSLALLLLGGCVSGTTAYFRKIDADIDGIMRGKYPVSDSIGKDVNCYRFDYDGVGKLLKIKYLRSAISELSDLPYGATQVRFKYSDESEKKIFLNSRGKVIGFECLELRNNQPVTISSYGSTGNLDERYALIRNENGQVSRINFLNEKDDRISNTEGFYEVRYRYDNRGNKSEVSFCAADGQRQEIEGLGFAIAQYEYDDYGNTVEERFYGADEKPKEIKGDGAALVSSTYDGNGNIIERRQYGIDGKLKENRSGRAFWRFKYNDRGDRVEVKCYGANEQLNEGKAGWAILRLTYDYKKNHQESRFYGADGTPKSNSMGTAILLNQYDPNGNQKETRFLGINGQLKENNKRVAIIRYEYDQEGKETKTIYFDRNGRVIKEE